MKAYGKTYDEIEAYKHSNKNVQGYRAEGQQ